MGRITAGSEPKRADARYWLYEKPVVYETGRNAIRFYPQAGKLQIALPDYTEATENRFSSTGIEEVRKPGKLAALDLTALEEDQETLAWLLGILEPLRTL